MRLWQRRTGSAADRPYPDRPEGTPSFEQLRHIVILTMSDHSYDNLLGMMPGRGDGLPFQFRRLDTAQPYAKRNSWSDSHLQTELFNLGFFGEGDSRQSAEPGTGDDRHWAFGYWTDEELPYWHALARTFPLAARWFSSCLGPELPNRRFLVAGTANGVTSAALRRADKPHNGTIFDLMSRHGVSWAIFNTRVEPVDQRFTLGYQVKLVVRAVLGRAGLNALRTAAVRLWPFISLRWDDHARSMADVYPLGFVKRQRYVQGMEIFARRAREGTLPAVSFVDPDYSWFSGAPPQDAAVAESFVAQVVEAVMHGPGWRQSLLILLHDSHGGYYDHVSPPSAPDPDADSTRPRKSPNGAAAAAFDRLGFRVPAVIISPYAKPEYVTNTVYDHTSVLKLIERQWNLPPLTSRDAAANDPLDALDFISEPFFLTPPKLPQPEDRTSAYRAPAIGSFKADNVRSFVVRVLQVCSYALIGFAAFLTGNAIFESVVVYATALIAARLVVRTGFWRNWAFWQPDEQEQNLSPIYGTALALLVLTVFITLLSSVLYVYGFFETTPTIKTQVPLHFLALYVWNIFDAIPGLRITETFNWQAPLTFADPVGRSVLIAYRLLVLAPVITLVVKLIQPRHDPQRHGAG